MGMREAGGMLNIEISNVKRTFGPKKKPLQEKQFMKIFLSYGIS